MYLNDVQDSLKTVPMFTLMNEHDVFNIDVFLVFGCLEKLASSGSIHWLEYNQIYTLKHIND